MGRKSLIVGALAALLSIGTTGAVLASFTGPAPWINGNDTGGIIPWTPENERASFEIASTQCARWNKFPVATSIHRVPGDYIAYTCVWDPPAAVVVGRHHRRIDVKIEK